MADETSDRTDERTDGGPSTIRNAGTVALCLICVLALFIGAISMPASGITGGESLFETYTPTLDDLSGGYGPPSFEWPSFPSLPHFDIPFFNVGNNSNGDPCAGNPDGCRVPVDGNGSGTNGSSAYAISIQPDPVPGQDVTVTVTRNGEPVSGITVRFVHPDRPDRRRVLGQTDAQGNVTGRVPYWNALLIELDISGSPSSVQSLQGRPLPRMERPNPQIMKAGLSGQNGLQSFVSPPERQYQQESPSTGNQSVYRLPTAGEVEVISGSRLPGESVTLRATIENVPIREGVVRANGKRIGKTDRTGVFTYTIPASATDSITFRITRGDVNASDEIRIRNLEVSTNTAGLIARAGGDVIVTVEAGGEPVRNAAIYRDGTFIAQTDTQGNARVSLPWKNTVVVAAEGLEQRTTQRLEWLFVPLVIAGLIPLLLIAGIVTAGYRRRESLRASLAESSSILTWLFTICVQSIRRAKAWLVSTRKWVIEGLHSISYGIGSTVLWALGALNNHLGRDAVAGAKNRLLDWIPTWGTIRAGVGTACQSLGEWIYRTLGNIISFVRGISLRALVVAVVHTFRRESSNRASETEAEINEFQRATAKREEAEGDEEPSLPPIDELWRRFARQIVPGTWRYCTPSDVERQAINKGYPAAEVTTFANAFREHQYSPSVTKETISAAREAYRNLEDHTLTSGGQGQ